MSDSSKPIRDLAYEAMLLGNISGGVIGTDAGLIITYWGKGAERMFGFTEAEALGKTPIELLRPTYQPGEREAIFEDLDRRGTTLAILRIRHKDGTEIFAEANSTRFFDDHGNSAGYVIVYRDATERYRTERALEESEARASALIKYAPTGIYEIDFRGPRFTSVNDAMCRILGYSREELFAIGPAGLLDEESRARFAERIRRQLGGQPIEESVEYRVRKKNGDFIYAILNVSVRPTTEDPYKVLVIAHDITQRKQMEEALKRVSAEAGARAGELQRLSGELELRVRERTAELAAANERLRTEAAERSRLEQHLRQVQKLEALGTLAGGIAHDFNNILNPIFISTELALLDTSLDPATRRHLEINLEAAKRGRDLVKQVIAFSRQKEKERKPLKAGPVINEAIKFMRASLPSTIEIAADIQPESGFILGDQAQIHQVVMNLCSNAAYAMRANGGILAVRLAELVVDAELAARVPSLKPGHYLGLSVADTGTGMTPAVRERAFDPFYTTKPPGEGSGMGLAVVAGIVRDYGGAIDLDSEEGKGSVFNIYLPSVTLDAVSQDVAPEGLPTGSERVLLIDDEEDQLQTVRSVLERLGYKVVTSTDPQDALALFRADSRAVDLVITDQTMPRMTGMKVAEELLRIRPDLPIVLCTGFSEVVSARQARALGVREFLMKPYSVLEIAESVRRALRRGRG
jgi:PAS domain S-box-containing protein